MHCINISHPDYKALENSTSLHPDVLKAKISLWMDKNGDERFPTSEELGITTATVNATLKIISAFDKLQRNVFTADKLQGWLNDLQKQGVPSQQLELFKENAKPGMTKNEIAAAIAANYSYTVEINIAKEISRYSKTSTTEGQFFYEGSTYEDRMWEGYFKNNIEISQQEFQKASKEYHSKRDTETQPTQYYSNLTVSGGTNYTENEIATPGIVPSIKGHAQFATDKGIGWFRSDDKADRIYNKEEEIKDENGNILVSGGYSYIKGNNKTRRILEVQSDLFQKGRDKENLTATLKNKNDQFVLNGIVYDTNIKNFETGEKTYTKRNENFGWDKITKEEYDIAKEKLNKENKENNFLQLLNKDNNWVTFFIKSIIQDSAKKGYEKVLFPRLDTIIQIESQNRFKTYKEAEAHYKTSEWIEKNNKFKEQLDQTRKELADKKTEVAKIKSNPNYDKTLDYETPIKNLEDRVSKAYEKWHGIQPTLLNTANFYEFELANRLDDIAGGNKNNRAKGIWAINQITDEYGNTWNEVEIKEERDQNTILYQKENPAQAKARILKQLNANKEGFINPHKYGELLKLVGDYNKINGSEALQMLKAVNDYYYIVAKGSILSQVSNETKEAPIKELDNKLKAWAKTHSISIESIDTLIERFGDRYEKGILGVADFANALIGIADNAKIDTLPEEIAHFAVELMKNDPSVVRALQTVDQTEIYGIVKEEYKDIYKNEEDFRKEAVGKILAQEIVNAHKNENAEERGFWAYLKAIKEKFVKWVKKTFNPQTAARQELETILKPLAISILNNEKIGTLPILKNIIVNPGVAELFESNPELANAVYESLGFTEKTDYRKEKNTFYKDVKSKYNFESINSLLNSIVNNTKNPNFKRLANTFSKIKELEKVKLIENNNLSVNGTYSLSTNSININVDRILKRSDLKKYDAEFMLEQTILHEIVHALTKKATTSSERNEFIRNIENLAYKLYSKEINDSKSDFKKYLDIHQQIKSNRENVSEQDYEFVADRQFKFYGLTNLDEFLTMSMTNPDFRNKLKQTNLWEELKYLVSKFLGIIKTDLDFLENNFDKFLEFTYGVNLESQITPQQKQQAQQLYSQYLDTIFPYSKVKDIVYRGDKSKTINGVTQFLKGERKDLLFLSTNKEVAKNTLYHSDFSEFIYKKDEFGNLTMTTEYEPDELKGLVRGPKNFIAAIVDIQNPLVKNAKGQSYRDYKIDGKNEYETIKEAKEKIKSQENDSLIVENVLEGDIGKLPSTNIGLSNPEQIHILGGKQDIEGFKQFVTSFPNSTPLYQLDKEEEEKEEEEVPDSIIENKKKFLEEAVFQLQARMKKLKAGLKSVSVINAIDSELNKINQDIAKGEMDLAISRFIKLASGEIASITKTLLSARESGNINSGIVTRSQDFLNMYDNIFNKFLKSMYDNNIPVEETEELRKQIHNIAIEIRETKSLNSNLLQKVSSTTLDAANTDANGNKIDPDFDPDMVAKETSEDVSNWRLQVGNYKYADSKLLKAAHKIIFDSVQRIKRFATKTGNDLLSAQQAMLKSGGKIEDLIETDSDGNLGHFFIQEYDLGKYYKEMAKTKEEIAKALGFENYNDIQVQFLSKEDLEKRNTLWKQFFAKNTKKEKVISKTSRGISTVEISVPNDSYKSKKFEQAMQNPATKAYYELLIKTKKEAVDKLPLPYRTQRLIYMVPPMLKSTIERVGQIKGAKSFMGTMATLASESLFINQDETQFGQLNPLNNKMVPIYFTRELNSSKDLSYDVARTVTLFSEMAENFREKNKIAGDLGAIQYTLAERNYFNKKGQRKEGIETNEYKALEILLDSHVFGIERDAVATKPLPENKITKALGIAGKQFSWTKASQRFATFIRNNNLAFNIPTSISGWLKGSGDSIIEDAIGIYTTTESKNWARGEFFSNLFQVIGELGKAKQTNKMHLMLQQAGVVELERMLYETTKNRAIRKIANRDLMYTTFATGDYGIKGRVALAIYDNYRLYNGQFVTRANYFKLRQVEDPNKTQKEFKKEWSQLREKSLYNAYDVVDGNLAVKPEFEKYVTPEVLNSAAGKIENVTTYVDGTMSKTDKGRLARTFAGDFLLMHRGWFIGMVDTRFRREGTNMITEEEEIGTYRASFDFLFRHFFKTLVKDRAGLQAAFATWDTLSPAKKRGVAKTALDLLYLNIVALVASMANLAADDADDEDWTTQYLAYQMNRLLLEQGAAWSPAELVQMIDEPVVGARMIKDLLDISEAFSGEVYESGMYKGATHAEKYWFRKQPFKNLYEMQYPELKNRFIKNLVDSKVYDWMSPEQVNSVTNKGLASSWLLPTGLASDQDTEDENMKVIVDSLQEETEEENGFN